VDSSSDELNQQTSQPNCLTRSSGSRDIFCLTRRQRDYPLFRRLPCNRPTSEEEDLATGALPIIDVSYQVAVEVAQQLRCSFLFPPG
jgi:hypothetical protein